MNRIGIISAKGGQGVTTIASALAVTISSAWRVHLTGDDDTRAALGVPTGTERVSETLTVSDEHPPADGTVYEILDGAPGDVTYLATRACYLALRRAAADKLTYDGKVAGVILITEPGRVLNARDVAAALGVPVVAEIPYDVSVARAIDAGLLARRLPESLRTGIGAVLEHYGTVTVTA